MAPHLEHFPLGSTDFGPVTAVRFTGPRVSLDGETIPALAEELLRLADDCDGHEVRLDFHNVDFVGGKALGVLVALHQRLLATGGRLALDNLTPLVAEVFTATQLDRLLDLGTGPLEAQPEVARAENFFTQPGPAQRELDKRAEYRPPLDRRHLALRTVT